MVRLVEWITAEKAKWDVQREAAKAALQPFADAFRASLPPSEGGLDKTGQVLITLADCQRAAEVLPTLKDEL